MGLFKYVQSGQKLLTNGFNDPVLALHYLLHGNRKAAQLQVRRVAEALGYEAHFEKFHYLMKCSFMRASSSHQSTTEVAPKRA